MNNPDSGLISALRVNVRASVTELSEHLGVPHTSVRSRIDKRVESGKIVGFSTGLEGDDQDQPVRGVTLIEFARQNLQALDSFMKQLRLVDGIASSETSVYLATVRSTKPRPAG